MATEHYNQNTGCLYSLKNLLVCGAQFARTHNTLVFMRTRKPRSVERQKKPPAFLRFRHQGADSWLAALFARELLIRADTAHCVHGLRPLGFDGPPRAAIDRRDGCSHHMRATLLIS